MTISEKRLHNSTFINIKNDITVFIPLKQTTHNEKCLFYKKRKKNSISIIKKYKN